MNGLMILIPIALLFGLCALAVFFWALRAGQFEDLDGAALRIFLDEDGPDCEPDAAPDGKPASNECEPGRRY